MTDSDSSRFNAEDSQLIADLHLISQKSPKLVRSTVYPAPSDPTIQIRSWKMNEFKYYDVPSPFPTLARGLFTRELKEEAGSDQPRYQIVARGYDKFFNIGEVPWTDWSSLEAHTGPEYTLSVKSNGCIIFIAAISPSELIVTSKHALGEMNDYVETHSQAGHRWLKTHLASKDKTEEQLATALWEKNWTAIAEVGSFPEMVSSCELTTAPFWKLCDDDFEEHVLAYPPDKSGLYLHGINETRKEFHTLPTHVVDAFAEEWGFLKTTTVVYDTLEETKKFTDEIAKTGEWKGEPLEGFVVRTHIVDPKPGSPPHGPRPPYPTGSSFFFKVKFDEPYMMYRNWREITKSLLSAKDLLNDTKLPTSKMKRKETQVYLKWVRNEIETNRTAFQGYAQGKGIITNRERFLSWLGTEQGKVALSDLEESDQGIKEFDKTVIVPVAVPGCGKTSVSVALAHLFGFGHTQSDDAKSAPAFIKNVINLLKQHDVVIADKNNHLRQHREALREAVAKIYSPVRLLALNWVLDQPQTTVLRLCGDRIFDRGDKHQTLRADKVRKSHENVIRQFIIRTEELANSEVDASIEMNISEPLEAAVARAVDGCVNILGLERPSQERIDEAVAVAKGYAPETKKGADKNEKKAKASAPPRYFGILADLDLEALVTSQMEREEDIPCNGRTFWRKLVSDKRIAGRPHITIVHKACLPAEADLWERCSVLDQLPAPPLFSFTLGHLVWNDRVMALAVEDLELAKELDNDDDPGQEKHEFVSKLPAEVRDSLHITVGTLNADVLPYEAKGLVEVWRKGKRTGIGSLELEGLSARGRIRGLMS
ncbi:RNA ligase-domain-containing protein [Lanmaoa asiatica]|nr:RNA ligase-domain-containing protein [Lanmaoa asiatica]